MRIGKWVLNNNIYLHYIGVSSVLLHHTIDTIVEYITQRVLSERFTTPSIHCQEHEK